MDVKQTFLEFLNSGFDRGGFETEDVLAAVLPLFVQVKEAHDLGLVGPLEGIEAIHVDGTHLYFENARLMSPADQLWKVEQVQQPKSAALEIVGEYHQVIDPSEARIDQKDLLIGTSDAFAGPAYLPGYMCWEHKLDHHDQLTDVYSLGVILASLACRLDFTETEDLELFVTHRENLFDLNQRINPVLASLIVQMTELNRHRRPQDLGSVIKRLKSYREQLEEVDLDFTKIKGFREANLDGKRKIIQSHLRNRLFEISRRNRLIYFKPTLQTVNLTLASVPLLLDYRNIRPEQLFIWKESLADAISKTGAISLGSYVRFEDAPYLPGVLDKIISESRRDRAEFGFEQLRLVLCFLRWHNLKESPEERIDSPLLLLPVDLTKKRGVRDSYVLKPLTSEAEVNPALRHYLKSLYGISLPEAVDLQETTLDIFYDVLLRQIRSSEPGINLIKVEKPQIRLIHAQARQRLDQYRRRIKLTGRGVRTFENIDYSYSRENYQPLGLQLFLRRIRPASVPFADVFRERPLPRTPHLVDPAQSDAGTLQQHREMYAMKESPGRNPYNWEFDLCSLTLGNFNYRKMSLVQDYSRLLENDFSSNSFDTIFSLKPREVSEQKTQLNIDDQYLVVPSDPTQTSAISEARKGKSYIIQGPPGTGKSQTITNLIADYAARGKRVLFVCEKRAAIDVVFYRLKIQGLDELCCLIHDSQTDKKEFIADLKRTYEGYLREDAEEEQIVSRREQLVRLMEQELTGLSRFSDAMQTAFPEAGIPLRRLLSRLVQVRNLLPALEPVQSELLPHYCNWLSHGALLERLSIVLKELGRPPSLGKHSLRLLKVNVIESDHPIRTVLNYLDRTEAMITTLQSVYEASGVPFEFRDEIQESEVLIRFACELLPLAEQNLLFLVDPKHARSVHFEKLYQDFKRKAEDLERAKEITKNWKEKLPQAESRSALEQAAKLKGAMAFLKPAYWRLRKILNLRYDFSAHVVKPGWVQILTDLDSEWKASDAYHKAVRQLEIDFEIPDINSCLDAVEKFRKADRNHRSIKALCRNLVQNENSVSLIRSLTANADSFFQMLDELRSFLSGYDKLSLPALKEELIRLRSELAILTDLLPLLRELSRLPDEIQDAVRSLPLTSGEMEAGMAEKTLGEIYRVERHLSSFDGRTLQSRVERLEEYYRDWMKTNAAFIRSQVRKQFQEHVRISSLSAAQLDKDQRLFKRNYSTGRREMEHEFSKTMRYRSIRDLADGETGMVIRDLKPIWLMSPLSVSDTIPLSSGEFDVVIFDEASQIPLEEGVPAAHRSNQVIVVGDEMQLPPTNFFSASRPDTEESLLLQEEGNVIEYELDADSFLTQAARNMSSTQLGWHYRSRYESLISFSNSSFYQGNLLTIPDRKLLPGSMREIRVASPVEAELHVEEALKRSISFHFLENGVYEKRSNRAEADYIAHLVRATLKKETKMSIGIVAFSEAQQSEIESALNRLGIEEPEFQNRLESEFEREEAGEFCGLFVKNLENVQGDERDVIILSICYGYDAKRKMLMNFGPINQRGGEKRLNVIFSRARRHMMVISSIRHYDITNVYNDGANCLRNFLEYSYAVSAGDTDTARRILVSATGKRETRDQKSVDIVTSQILQALKGKGFESHSAVGQSSFRCDLAVCDPNAEFYRLGILIDTEESYHHTEVLERYLLRPQVLNRFGWDVMTVLTRDWYHDPDDVLHRIERRLTGVSEAQEQRDIEDGARASSAPAEVESRSTVDVQDQRTSVQFEKPLEPTVESHPSVSVSQEPSRYFEFIGGASRKFWQVTQKGSELYVQYGRIGTRGQTQLKTFDNPDEAERDALKLIREKLNKGYVEKETPS